MTETDRPRFAVLLGGLAIALPGKEPSDCLLRIYWQALRDLPLADLERAIETGIRRWKFFPTPVEILDLAQPRNLEAEAGRVWARLQLLTDYAPTTGTYWRPSRIQEELGDAALEAFHAAGGSRALETGDPYWTAKRFTEAYTAIAGQHAAPTLGLGESARRVVPPDPRVVALTAGIGRPMPPDRKGAA